MQLRQKEIPNNYTLEIGDTIVCRPTSKYVKQIKPYMESRRKTAHVAIYNTKFFSPSWSFKNESVLLTERTYIIESNGEFLIDVIKNKI